MAALPTRTVYASVRMALEYPIDAVWAVAGRFDGLEAWADGVSVCSVEGDGVGCVRTVTRGGVVREQLESRDPGRHQISYTILAPHALPADDVRGEITLTALGPEATQIVWRSEAARFHAPPEALGERIEAFYRASIGGLERVLSTNRSAKPEANSGPAFTGAG